MGTPDFKDDETTAYAAVVISVGGGRDGVILEFDLGGDRRLPLVISDRDAWELTESVRFVLRALAEKN